MVMSLALISSKVMRRRRRRRGDDLVAPEIPLDLQIEILTKLPAKSLMRFKCVSKLWYSLIRSRYFSNCYFTVAPPPRPPRLYMSLVDHLECNSMEVCNNPRESVLLSLTASSSSAKSFDQDLTMPGMGGRNMVVLRGLILYIVCRKACVYNPTTRQTITLPPIKSNIFGQDDYRKSVLYFFGHDPVLDQYKVVCTVVISSKNLKRRITSEHWVFVLEPGASWKKIEFDQPHLPTRLGLCINGVIYYLASTCMRRDIVVSFNVCSEKFSMIQGPPLFSTLNPMGFIEYGGKPAVFDHTHLRRKGLMDLWVLEEAAKWTNKSLVLQPCQMHLVNSNNIRLKVKGTTQNGEIILAPLLLIYPYYVLYYDLKKNDMRKVKIRGIPEDWFGKLDTNLLFYFQLMDKSQSIMHLEI